MSKTRIRKQSHQAREGLLMLLGGIGLLLVIALTAYLTVQQTHKQADQPALTPAAMMAAKQQNPNSAPAMPGMGGDSGTAATTPNSDSAKDDVDALSASIVAGKNDPEIQNLVRQIDVEPDNAHLLTELGNKYYNQHNYPKAIDAYYRALKNKANDPDVLTDTGTCYFYLGMPHLALDYYERALTVDPNHLQAYFNQGVVHATYNRPDLARKALEKARSLADKDPEMMQRIQQMLQHLSSDQPVAQAE